MRKICRGAAEFGKLARGISNNLRRKTVVPSHAENVKTLSLFSGLVTVQVSMQSWSPDDLDVQTQYSKLHNSSTDSPGVFGKLSIYSRRTHSLSSS